MSAATIFVFVVLVCALNFAVAQNLNLINKEAAAVCGLKLTMTEGYDDQCSIFCTFTYFQNVNPSNIMSELLQNDFTECEWSPHQCDEIFGIMQEELCDYYCAEEYLNTHFGIHPVDTVMYDAIYGSCKEAAADHKDMCHIVDKKMNCIARHMKGSLIKNKKKIPVRKMHTN